MGTLRDSSGKPVVSGSGAPVRTRYDDDEDKKSKEVNVTQDYASTGRRAGATSPFAGPKEFISEEKRAEKETKNEESDGSVAGKGARNLALEKDETPSPVKKAMKVAEKAPAPKKEKAEAKYEDTGAKVGSQGSFKFNSKPMSVEEARKKAKEMTSGKKEPTEAQKESGRKFSEEKLKKQKESFESSPIGGFIKRLGESSMEKAERKAKEIRGYKSGGKVSSASSRADGIAQRGKTRGRIY